MAACSSDSIVKIHPTAEQPSQQCDRSSKVNLSSASKLPFRRPAVRPLRIDHDSSKNSLVKQRRQLLGRSLSLNVADSAGKWKEAFALFDRDGDGMIDSDELASEMRRFGMKVDEREIQLLLSQWDNDGKGALTLLEFTSLMNSSRCLLTPLSASSSAAGGGAAAQFKRSNNQPTSSTQLGRRHRLFCQQSEDGALNTEELLELRAAFDLLDLDGDGALNREEIRLALELLEEDSTDEDVDLVVSAADSNGNGCVSFKEFCKLLHSGDSAGGVQFPGKSTFRPKSTGDGVAEGSSHHQNGH